MIIGLVGKPSAGKSTFFKASTLAEVEIANYPFTTIEKNEGIGFVKVDCVDKEFKVNCKPRFGYCVNHKRFVPVQMIDVAGLVPGAYEGKGRGNQFLDDLNQADVLVHIVDISGSINESGEQVNIGEYDPSNDIEFLENELDMWYFQILERGWIRFSRQIKQENLEVYKAIGKQLSGLKVNEDMVKEAMIKLKMSNEVDKWNEEDRKKLARELRKRSKPIIIAANKIDVSSGEGYYNKVREKYKDYIIIPCSSESELALKEANKKSLIKYVPGDKDFEIIGKLNDKQERGLEFIKKNVLEKFNSTGVQEVLDKAVFSLLKYIAVFPVANSKLMDKDDNILPDCFLVPEDITALELAYKVHEDLGSKFIRGVDVKSKKTIGKEHKLKNRDIIEIVSGK